MSLLTQNQLKRIIAAQSAIAARTDRLEKQIRIGVGFHGKWYRSQREHWLGWIVAKERMALQKGENPDAIVARKRWTNLNCIPMMFWLAEVAGVPDEVLTGAESAAVEAAAINDKDCQQHGKAMRVVLPWTGLEPYLANTTCADSQTTVHDSDAAFEYLASLKNKYRKLKDETDAIYRDWLGRR